MKNVNSTDLKDILRIANESLKEKRASNYYIDKINEIQKILKNKEQLRLIYWK